MFTVGPRLTIVPLARSSDPITAPYRVASDRSQVAASDTPAGSWVTPDTPSPTPFGPFPRLMAGPHSRGMALVLPVPITCWLAPAPASRAVLSSSDIRGSRSPTRRLTGSAWFSHGHAAAEPGTAGRGAPGTGLPAAARTAGTATASNPAARALRGNRRINRSPMPGPCITPKIAQTIPGAPAAGVASRPTGPGTPAVTAGAPSGRLRGGGRRSLPGRGLAGRVW